jgi:hypothetical protein
MQGALPPCMPPYPISGLPGHGAPGTIRSSYGGRRAATPGLTKLLRQDRHSANPLRLHQNHDDSCVNPMTFQRRNDPTNVSPRSLPTCGRPQRRLDTDINALDGGGCAVNTDSSQGPVAPIRAQ